MMLQGIDMLTVRAVIKGKTSGFEVIADVEAQGASTREASSALWRMIQFGCLRIDEQTCKLVFVKQPPEYDDLMNMIQAMLPSCKWLIENTPCSYPKDMYHANANAIRDR